MIVNAAECEPFVCCDEALIREFADQVVKGAEYLMQASAADAGIIAIESDKHEAIAAMQEPLQASSLTLRLLAAKHQRAMSAYSSSHSPGKKSLTARILQSGAFWFKMSEQQKPSLMQSNWDNPASAAL